MRHPTDLPITVTISVPVPPHVGPTDAATANARREADDLLQQLHHKHVHIVSAHLQDRYEDQGSRAYVVTAEVT